MMHEVVVKFKKLHPDAKAPHKAHNDIHHPDAGWDLFALQETELLPGEVKLIPTGIAIELPEGTVNHFFEAQIRSRSGHRKQGIVVPVGTIDAGYRGDVGCIIFNLSPNAYTIKKGEKICQMVVVQLPRTKMQIVEELSESRRGEGGFGSTGK